MSDRVALNGRSTCDEGTCDQNTCEPFLNHAQARFNRNMSKSKGWTLQSSLLTFWMEKTRVNNQTKIDDDVNLLKTL